MPSAQSPIRSGLGPSTTARDALAGRDLTGVRAVVTGGYSGIGLETTRTLAEAGAHVVVPARTPEKARRNLAGLARVELDALDLMDPASVDGFARRVLARGDALDLLIDSAGIMAAPLARDARGNESQLSANHLGHFQLAVRLWPALRAAGRARVVALSSRAHRIAGVDFDDPNFERRPYDRWQAYGQSKSANALFALALDARGERHGVRAFSVHPGTILTELARNLTPEDLRGLGAPVDDEPGADAPPPSAGSATLTLKSVAQGAATTIWCATSPQLDGMGGVYCEDCDVAPLVAADHAGGDGVRPWAADPALAERLWDMSEALTGVRFVA